MSTRTPLNIPELVAIWREIAANSTGEKQVRFTRMADSLDDYDQPIRPPKTIKVSDLVRT